MFIKDQEKHGNSTENLFFSLRVTISLWDLPEINLLFELQFLHCEVETRIISSPCLIIQI